MESLSGERMASMNDPLITVKMPIILLQCNLEFFHPSSQPKMGNNARALQSQRDVSSQGKHWIIHIMHTVFHDKLLCSSCVFGSFTLRNMLLNFIKPPGAGLCGYKLK